MRRVQGTLGLVVPRGTLEPSGRVAERSGSGLGSRDRELWPCGCRQRPRWKSLHYSASPLPPPIAPSSLSLRLRLRVQAGRYLGPRRGSTPTGRPARRSSCSPGSRSSCGTSAACRGPPFGPAQWNYPRASPLGARARTRGAHAGCAAFTPTPARLWNYLVYTKRAGEGGGRGRGGNRPRPLSAGR